MFEDEVLASRLRDRNPPLYINNIIKGKKEMRSRFEINTGVRRYGKKKHTRS